MAGARAAGLGQRPAAAQHRTNASNAMSAQPSASACIFCRIVSGDIPGQCVYEDDQVAAFEDIAPQAPVHLLVVPRRHVDSVDALADDPGLLGRVMAAAVAAARARNLAESGYRLVTNHGRDGAQSVAHLHVHVLGGRQLRGQLG